MSSIETINNNGEVTTNGNNSKNSTEFKSNGSIGDLNEEIRSSLNNSHTLDDEQQHMQPSHVAICATNVSTAKILPKNVTSSAQTPNKNVKIASCLDKWYKELKGNVLVSLWPVFVYIPLFFPKSDIFSNKLNKRRKFHVKKITVTPWYAYLAIYSIFARMVKINLSLFSEAFLGEIKVKRSHG